MCHKRTQTRTNVNDLDVIPTGKIDDSVDPPPKNRIEKDRAHYFEFGETGIFAILEVVLECMHISSTLYAPDSNRSIVYSYKSVPKGGKKYSTIRRIHWKCLK